MLHALVVATAAAAAPPPAPAPSLTFGPPGFELELNAATLEMRNLSVQSADGSAAQGFVLGPELPLWFLNVTDCSTALPHGTRVTPCIDATCANTSHALSPDGRTLTLSWSGVPLPPPHTARLAVTVNITQLPDGQPGTRRPLLLERRSHLTRLPPAQASRCVVALRCSRPHPPRQSPPARASRRSACRP